MQWILWLDEHPGVATALPTVLLVVVTAWLGVMTWLNARRTKELARQSADALKVQIAAIYFQVRALAAAEAEARGFRLFGRPTSTRELQQLFEKAIPGLWAELDPILFPPAKEPQQHSPNAGTAPRQQSSQEELP